MAEPSHEELSRAGFLRLLFGALDECGVRYCVLHSWGGLPEKLLSDLDLAVHPADRAKLPLVFRSLQERGYRPFQCLNYAVKAFYFIFFWFEGSTPKNVAVDIVFEHRRNGLILMRGQELVAGRQRENLVWRPDPAIEFSYLLAKKTLKGSLPFDQEQRLKLLVGEIGQRQAEQIADNLFGERWKGLVVDACLGGYLARHLKSLRKQLLWRAIFENPFSAVRNLLGDGVRRIRRWFRPTGLFIAILGPDGVGKSTLAGRLVEGLGPAFRRHRVFHWRPQLLWQRKESGPVTDPHGRPQHSGWWSTAQLFSHILDYWLGYGLVIRPLLARSGLVVFDRYFHDLLVDPKRYRYGGPQGVTRALCSFIPKPDLVLVLDAPAEVIFSRKQEVAPEEVRRQRQAYLQMASDISLGGVIDASRPITQVCNEAAWTVTKYLARRFEQRYGSWLRLGQPQPPVSGDGWHATRTSRGEVLHNAMSRFIGCAPGSTIATQHNAQPTTEAAVPAVSSVVYSKRTGRKPVVGGSACGHYFVVLPSRKSPRWLLPVEGSQSAAEGFQIYTPYAWTTRITKQLVIKLFRAGWRGWGCHRLLITATQPLALESLIREVSGEDRPVFALSLGTGRYRKLTVQVMRPDGEILGYIKLPLTEEATERVRYEAEVLGNLSHFLVLRPHIPRVLHARNWEDGFILFLSCGPSRPGPLEFGPAHEEFLQTLWSVRPVETPGHALVERVARCWGKVEPLLNAEWRELGERTLDRARQGLVGEMIACGITHGDFTPWNTRLENGRLFVFDWESAAWDAPLLWDIFHFHVQVAGMLSKRNGRGLSPGRGSAERASFLLYLLSSVCQHFEEKARRTHVGLEYRRRLLADELSHNGN